MNNLQKWREYSGTYSIAQQKIAIVASRFNEALVGHLIQGACQSLEKVSYISNNIDIFRVPGAYELPFTCQQVLQTGRYQGLIALGIVIRGETPHFEYVAHACANGIQQVQLKTNLPITFGVLTTDTVAQAEERAGGKAGNKGAEAALALIEVMSLTSQING